MKAALNSSSKLCLNNIQVKPIEGSIGDKIIWFLTTVLLACFIILDTNTYISYILIGITGLILLVMLFRYRFKLPVTIGTFHYSILAFSAYCAITALWAIDKSAAIDRAITVFEILVCMSVLYCHYSQKNSVLELLDCVRWAGYVLTIYAILFYGFDTIRATLDAGERLENSFANINSIAMLASISLVLTVFRLFFYKFSLSIVFAIPEIILVASSGSRKALTIVAVGVVLVLLFRFSSKNILKTILRYIVIALICAVCALIVLQLPMFSGILERMDGLIAMLTGKGEVDHSAWLREQYILAGLKQFTKTPILGIGIANSNFITTMVEGKDTYLHNNFVELLACGGLVGFAIYYYIILWPLVKLWKGRKKGDPCTIAVIILLLILLMMDYGSVSYYSKNTYFYFMIYFLQVDVLYKHSRRFKLILNE